MQSSIQVTATTPGHKPLNIQESIESGEALNHSLIELEATVEGFIYMSRADFHPRQSKLLVYRRNPDKTIESVEFPECHDLRDAVSIMSEMFCLLHECVEAKDIDKAAALLMFNLLDTPQPEGMRILLSTKPLELNTLQCLTQRWDSPEATSGMPYPSWIAPSPFLIWHV